MTVYLIALCVLSIAGPVRADLLADQSPKTTGGTITPGGNWSYENRFDMQNFAERVVFDSAYRITGMAIYTYSYFAPVGRNVVVKTWAESGSEPDSATLQSFQTILSLVDTEGIDPYDSGTQAGYRVRAYADFGLNSFLLPAHTPLWIGMSGTDDLKAPVNVGLFGLTGLTSPFDGRMYMFNGNVKGGLTDAAGDMAMQLYGEPVDNSPVPEPTTILLLGSGFIGLAGYGRKKFRK